MTTERLAALNAGDELDFWGNDKPKCPHCGHDCDIGKSEWWDLYSNDDESHEKECPRCELLFTIRTRTSYSFSTDDQEQA